MKWSKKRIVGAVLGILAVVILFMIRPFDGLTPEAMRGLGLILCAIIFLSMEVLDTYVVAIFLCTSFPLFKVVDFGIAFSAFSETTFWLVIGVLGIGVAISKCGLLKRISLYALKIFPPTYKGILAALLGVGVICQPVMPSTSAKQSIVAPVAMGLGQTLGFSKQSKQLAGLFNAMYIGWSAIGCVFINASFLGYLFYGNLPEKIQHQFTWGRWAVGMIPWVLVIIIGSYFALSLIYRPKNEVKISRDYINQQFQELGPMSKQEKAVSIIMIFALFMWMLEQKIGISACVTSLVCLTAMIIIGVFDASDFNNKMAWTLIFMVGGLTNIASVMTKLKISDWLGTIIEPLFKGLLGKPYIFTIVLVLAIYLIRYIMVDWVTMVILFMVVLGPIAQNVGINPWVIMMICYCSAPVWVTKYQNGNMLIGYAAAGGDEMVKFKDVIPGAYAYMGVNIIALLVSMVYWSFLGYV